MPGDLFLCWLHIDDDHQCHLLKQMEKINIVFLKIFF